ncbi:hypothetical protein WH91_06950 [Devosia psychrophila]|uniref:mRNA interferase RelE/StbE n=1 Tax=Devosia psychrophila TaxID=728005 RepID=A0ABR5E0B5_9HYPH|nr:hypothetical protein [Devosia psychrophila]KKC33738.1 hypothetical protein WH91_06950 [Devosia psychrophila]
MKQITYTKAAARALSRMPTTTAALIRGKIVEYASVPASQANNVMALHGSSWIRLRIGDWRVIIEDGAVLEVLKVAPRGRAHVEGGQ